MRSCCWSLITCYIHYLTLSHDPDIPIEYLRPRETDNARFLDTDTQVHKFHTNPGPVVVLKRLGSCIISFSFLSLLSEPVNRLHGKERQFREVCKHCHLVLLYRTRKDSPHVFLVEGMVLVR